MAPRLGHVFKTIEQRLAEFSIPEPMSGCWLWLGAQNPNGYGQMLMSGRRRGYAHRISYEFHVGPIPDGLHIDHLCRNPCCINPDHMEPVTNAENTRRGLVSALRPKRDTCYRGHDLSISAYRDSQGHNQCRECLHIRQKAYYRRKRNGV